MEISRPSTSKPGSWTLVHRTETIKKTLDPIWFRRIKAPINFQRKPFELPLAALNLGKMEERLKFEVFDWNPSGKSDFIGGFEATLNEITKKSNFPLINHKKLKKRYVV